MTVNFPIMFDSKMIMLRTRTRILSAVAVAAMLGAMPTYAEEASEDGFSRIVLLEEFTTEQCNNCPPAAVKLHNVLANPAFSGRVVAVCHHVGFGSDFLTLPTDKDYLWFYNDSKGATYAPGLMIDRLPTFVETSAVFGMPSWSEEDISAEISKRLAVPSPVTVNVEANVDDDGCVTVDVSGEKTGGKQDRTMLTVYLVENNVPSRNQSGADKDYIHQHVTRAVNETWGKRIEWEGDRYAYQCVFDLDESWKLEDMEVVACVNRDIPSDVLKCEVVNAGSVSLLQNGVADIAAEGRIAVAYYDMQGRKLREQPSSGLCITLYSDGKAEKSFR